MTAIERWTLSLLSLAVGDTDRLNSLRPPNQSSFPRIPFPQIFHACFANHSNFHIPCALPRDVTAPESPFIEQMALSCLTQLPSAISINYRDFEFSAFKRGLI
jgi:hypothetical protein